MHFFPALILTVSAAAPQVTTPPAPPLPGTAMAPQRVDADGDGAVSRAEFLDQAARRFDRMDANRDGRLTTDERRTPTRRGAGRDSSPARDED